MTSLWGLWVILALAVFLAGVAGLVEYLLKRRLHHEDADHIAQRAQTFRNAVTKAVSVQSAASAFLSTLESSRRADSASAAQASLDAADLEAGDAPAAAKAAAKAALSGTDALPRPPSSALRPSVSLPSARWLCRNPVLRHPRRHVVRARDPLAATVLRPRRPDHACEPVPCMGLLWECEESPPPPHPNCMPPSWRRCIAIATHSLGPIGITAMWCVRVGPLSCGMLRHTGRRRG